jgi:hypothetical protein
MQRRNFISLLGGAAVAPILKPRVAYSQTTRKVPLVGYLWHAGSAEAEQPWYGAIIDGFAQLGYVQGRTIELQHRFPEERPELLGAWLPNLSR